MTAVTIVSKAAIAGAILMMAAACGSTPGERAVTGAAIGGAAGAAGGAIVAGGQGAAVGAVAGAATGAAVGGLTRPCTFGLRKRCRR